MLDLRIKMAMVKRAMDLDICRKDGISLSMDLDSADEKWALNDALLTADNQDFAHDIWGIQCNADRATYPATFDGLFVPRYATK